MTEIERRMDSIAIRQYGADRIAEELRVADVPRPIAADNLEQALAGSDMQPISHVACLLPQPPVSAWNTWISSSPATGSDSRERSRTRSPFTYTATCRRSAFWSSSTYPRNAGRWANTAASAWATVAASTCMLGTGM